MTERIINGVATASEGFWCRLLKDVDTIDVHYATQETDAYKHLVGRVNALIEARLVDPVTIEPFSADSRDLHPPAHKLDISPDIAS